MTISAVISNFNLNHNGSKFEAYRSINQSLGNFVQKFHDIFFLQAF